MEKSFCPKCNNEVEALKACGALQFFCNTCNELVSSKKILSESQNNMAKIAKEYDGKNES